MRNTEQYNNLSYVSFKIFPLCKYTFVPATVKLLETFLETILWNHFQLFCLILNDFSNVTKAPSIQYWFQSREQKKISWSQVRILWGSSGVVTFVFAKKSLTKPTGVLEHCREGETNWWVPIFWDVSFWPHSEGDRRIVVHISLFTVEIPINYTSEFR